MTIRLFNFCVGPLLLLGIAAGGNIGGMLGALCGSVLFLTLGFGVKK